MALFSAATAALQEEEADNGSDKAIVAAA